VEVFADDRVIGRVDDVGKLPAQQLGAFLLADVDDGGDPAVDVASCVAFRRVNAAQQPGTNTRQVDFQLVFSGFALQHRLDIWSDCVKSLRTEDVGNVPADDLFGGPADHPRISLADKAVAHVAAKATQHERGAVDDRFSLAG